MMYHTKRPITSIAGATALLFAAAGLAGCAGTGTPGPTESAPATTQAAPASDATTQPAEPDCTELDAETALRESIDEVPKPSNLSDLEWDMESVDLTSYNACSALSWLVVGPVGATGSSPHQIMLFHDGEYIGTATKIAYGFTPEVTRVEDNEISVTYTYLEPGDANADPSGRATATFTLDEKSGSVDMSGDVPPDEQD